jgi:hypothetical protein
MAEQTPESPEAESRPASPPTPLHKRGERGFPAHGLPCGNSDPEGNAAPPPCERSEAIRGIENDGARHFIFHSRRRCPSMDDIGQTLRRTGV